MERFVQAMIIARYDYRGSKVRIKPHSLEVFRIPEREKASFRTWLKENEPDLLKDLIRTGFTKVGSKSRLARIAQAYRRTHRASRIEWVTVPMVSNSLILWTGIHRVHGCPTRSAVRSVLYVKLQREPMDLPNAWVPTDSNALKGKAFNHAMENAYGKYVNSQGGAFGWSKQTIRGVPGFKIQPSDTKDWNPVYLRKLQRNGFIVIKNLVNPNTAKLLHYRICTILRTVLFRVRRKGMNKEIRNQALDMSLDKFAIKINEPAFKRARYCKHKSMDLWTGYDNETDAGSRRMRMLQGVPGYTKSSQMIDVRQDPTFAVVLTEAHAKIEAIVGTCFFGLERCSLRGPLAGELPPHTDDSIFTPQTNEKDVIDLTCDSE